MTKHTSALILFFVVVVVLFLYGCSHSGGGHLINSMGDVNLNSREEIINEQGRMSAIIFPSGAKIETLENNTLIPGVKVVVTEEYLASGSANKGYFSDYSPMLSYAYRITAFQESSNTSGGKTNVTTTEKPLRITFPQKQNHPENYIICIKESDSDPWRYFSRPDNVNLTGIRAAKSLSSGDCSVEVFRLGIKYALMEYSDSEKIKLPETIVTGLIASLSPSIEVKDGKYAEDIRIKGLLTGKMLDSINPADFRARITYRSNQSDEAVLKVNGFSLMQNNKNEKIVSGGNYVHSFIVDSVSGYSLNGSTGEFSFILNLNGVDTKSFPNNFLIEFFNKNSNSEKVLPYYYAEFINFEPVEKHDEPDPQIAGTYSITYGLDGGTVTPANPTAYDTASETFTLNEPVKEGYAFIGWTGSNGDTPQKDLSIIQGSTGNKIFTANYELLVYDIAYDLDGGLTASENPAKYDVTSSSIILTNPTKDGYRFTGWTGSNGNTPQITLIIEKGSTGNKNYKANYTTSSYVISYNLDGGTVAQANPTGYDTASESFTLTNPTKAGYNFIGWSNSEITVPQMTVTIESGSVGDKEFTANYKPVTYNIAYNLDGGLLAEVNPTKYDITSATIILNNPTKEGFTFMGWTGSNGNTPQTVLVIEKGSSENKTFTANWSKNSYRVTINKGTGISDVSGEGMHEYGSTVIASYTLIDGYEFDFWTGNNTESTFVMPANDVFMQANAKLKTYSISCNLNGGSVAAPNRTSYNRNSENITLVNPEKNGYTFDGWTGSNGNAPQTEVTIVTGSTGNKTYSANYSIITYSIEYYLNGGDAVGNPVSYDVTTTDIVLNNPTKPEFRFVGWTGSNGNEPEPTVTIVQGSSGDKIFSANYVQATNIINYNLNGGTNNPNNPHGFDPASPTFSLYQPTKTGYSFVGWTGSNGEVPQMTVTIETGSIGDRNYTAHFEEVPYTISYVLDGGINHPGNRTGYDVQTETFYLYEPTRTGYTFVGWTEGIATLPMILTKVQIGSSGDKVFTAHWIENVTLNLPGGIPLVMHKIPHGTFTMGSPDGELGAEYGDYHEKESPLHQVTLTKDFFIGKFEITQEQYEAVMKNNPATYSGYVDSPSRPVERVNWNDAKAFCASLTTYLSGSIPDGFSHFDLPTEAQWEYACRAGTTTSLNNGTNITVSAGNCNNLNELGWYSVISNSQTHPVGQKQPNAWGLYDMHGNVWEWCLDYFGQNYYQDCAPSCTDPTGPLGLATDSYHVGRGGCLGYSPRGCRSAFRLSSSPTTRGNYAGFRVVLVPNP